MATLEDLERRLARVEDEIAAIGRREFEQRAEVGVSVSRSSDAARLARGASEDVTRVETALRGHMRVLEALRRTQLEQQETGDARYAELKADVAEVKVGMSQIVGMLDTLIRRGQDGS